MSFSTVCLKETKKNKCELNIEQGMFKDIMDDEAT